MTSWTDMYNTSHKGTFYYMFAFEHTYTQKADKNSTSQHDTQMPMQGDSKSFCVWCLIYYYSIKGTVWLYCNEKNKSQHHN